MPPQMHQELVLPDSLPFLLQSSNLARSNSTSSLCELIALWPIRLIRCAQYLHNFIQLVDFIRAWKQWAEGVKLSHDAAEGEDVYRRVVIGGA